MTINDVLKERGLEGKSWGDVWYRPSKLTALADDKDKGDKVFIISFSSKISTLNGRI